MSFAERFGLPEEGSFSSRATSEAEMLRDLTDFTLSQRRRRGLVPPSVGISKPVAYDSIETYADQDNVVRGWTMDQKARRGGAAFDAHDTHPSDSYRERRWKFLSNVEGVRTRAYDDASGHMITPTRAARGLATVGVGFNMDRPGARDLFKAATSMSDEDFDRVRKGEKRLGRDQVRNLFDFSVRDAERLVHKKFGDTDLTEHQRLALVSLAFNSPSLIGPNLTRQVREGSFAEAREEILFRSNRRKHRGLARRRYMEAALFSGTMDAQAALPRYTDYIKRFA